MNPQNPSRSDPTIATPPSISERLQGFAAELDALIHWGRRFVDFPSTSSLLAFLGFYDSWYTKLSAYSSELTWFSEIPRFSGPDLLARIAGQPQTQLGGVYRSLIEQLETLLVRLRRTADEAMHPESSTGPRLFRDPSHPRPKCLLVHRADDPTRPKLTAFLEQLGLEPLAVSGTRDDPRSILAKSREFGEVDAVVMPLAAEDITPAVPPASPKPQLHPNVIFALGFYVGRLSPNRACVLVPDRFDLPGEYPGIGYVRYDDRGEWKPALTRMLRTSGLRIESGD